MTETTSNSGKRPRILLLELNRDGTVGGSHYCLRNVALALRSHGYEPVAGFLEDTPFRQAVAALGIETHVFPMPPATRGRVQRLFTVMFGESSRLRRRLRELKIDVLHQNNSVGIGEEWTLAARTARIPVVVHQRGYFCGHWFNRLVTDRLIDCCVAISRSVEDELRRETGIRRIDQIWDFVDTDEFRPLPAEERARLRSEFTGPQQLLVGMAGNIKEWKGQHVLLEALGRLPAAEKARVRCVFFGGVSTRPEDHAYRERLEHLVVDGGLAGAVTFAGFRSDMTRVYPSVDLLVHASTDPEPFGMVIAEAMACGTPVVASRGGGAQEIVEDGVSGWLSARGDAAALAERLGAIVAARDTLPAVGRAARARIEKHFSVAAAIGRLDAMYRDLLAART